MSEYYAAPRRRGEARPIGIARLLVTGTLLLAILEGGAAAQTACLQRAQGVPGNYNPPTWWGATPNTNIDDPRWVGAWSQPVDNGAGESGRFRALHNSTGLYLSWTVAYDPNQPPASASNNILYVGLQGATTTVLLRVNLTSVVPGNAVAVNPALKTFDGTSWSVPPGALPTWYSESVRGWVWTSPAAGGVVWTVQVHVPIAMALASGIDLGTNFKLWYEAKVPMPTPMNANNVITLFKWPTTAASVTAPLETYPAPATWGDGHLSTGAGDPTCTSGVSIAVMDIGTTNSPSSRVNWSSTAPYPSNTFFARPLNNTGSPIGVGQITARFRIANWGSVIGVGSTWEDIPGGGAVTNDVPIPLGPQSSSFYPNHFDHAFAPGESLFDGLLAGTKNTDQCLLVELSGPNITFINNSVRRNLSFVGASVVEKDAEISVVGLPPLPGGRDVYLYVQKYRMPDKAEPGDTVGITDTTQYQPPTFATTGSRMVAPTIAQLTASIPSYRVHVFHSTTDTIEVDGVKHPLLEPQSSFGFFLLHKGPIVGWRTILEGADSIAPNWYRIRHVQTVAKIRTRIQAQAPGEAPIEPTKNGLCGRLRGAVGLSIVLSAVVMGVLLYVPRRRKAGSIA